jgi:hypothetical protein
MFTNRTLVREQSIFTNENGKKKGPQAFELIEDMIHFVYTRPILLTYTRQYLFAITGDERKDGCAVQQVLKSQPERQMSKLKMAGHESHENF